MNYVTYFWIMECLNCKKPVPQTPKKRSRLYCSEKCRVQFFRANASDGKPKRGRGRPRKIDAGVIQAEIREVKTQLAGRGMPILKGPMKEVLQEASIENAKLGIEAMINAIKAEKIPKERDTALGRKSWILDQKKRIQELENKIK